ncbi:MAG: hypothetical protein QOJ29_3429 [Thermoleophilaceae bacterium]|nr:hypothetical protein [Thermoleophilaceae bacterium]
MASARSPRAIQALQKVEKLKQGKGVKTGRELTPALNALFHSLPDLSAADRRQAEGILARPDDSQTDPRGTHKWIGPEAGSYSTEHFKVHYTAVGADASDAMHAKQLGDILENEVYPCENGAAATACAGAPGLGWRNAPSDFGLGGDDKTDVYIEDLYTNEHVFGYVALDPDQTQDPTVPHFSYMVMDKDYRRFGDGSEASGLAAAQVTAAHEYNHVLQNGYDYLEDTWMFEATAVYMEEKVYPSNNDYLNYVEAWAANPKQPLTRFSNDNLKPYGSAVWNHWLDHRFGPGLIRNAWEQSISAADFAPGAYGAAVAGVGAGGFPDEFDRFSAAVAEWNAPGSGFPDHYPDVPREAALPTGTQTTPFSLPHTTFLFFDVPVPASAPPLIRLTGRLPDGTSGAIALIGRTGADPNGGTVTTSLTPMPSGGTAAVQLDNPAQFGRITAVVVNADPSKGGFDQAADDYIYTRDATDVVVGMSEPGPPVPVTGAAGLIADHSAFVGGTVDPHLNDTSWSVQYGETIAYGKQSPPQTIPASTVGALAVTGGLQDLKANTTYHYRLFATNAAGATVGQDAEFKTARDVTKPVVALTVKPQRLAKVKKRGVAYGIRCNERCSGTAQLVLTRAQAKRLRLPRVLGTAHLTVEPAERQVAKVVRLTGRVRKLLAAKRGFSAQLVVAVADQSHNRSKATRRASLRS